MPVIGIWTPRNRFANLLWSLAGLFEARRLIMCVLVLICAFIAAKYPPKPIEHSDPPEMNALAFWDMDGDCACAREPCMATIGSCERLVGGDCDDSDSEVHPMAADVCDGKDNDCDGAVDEGLTVTIRRPPFREAEAISVGCSVSELAHLRLRCGFESRSYGNTRLLSAAFYADRLRIARPPILRNP